jgi:hypothetical protein
MCGAGGITHNGPISLAMRGEKYDLGTHQHGMLGWALGEQRDRRSEIRG